jgi:hypothetical protein
LLDPAIDPSSVVISVNASPIREHVSSPPTDVGSELSVGRRDVTDAERSDEEVSGLPRRESNRLLLRSVESRAATATVMRAAAEWTSLINASLAVVVAIGLVNPRLG